LESAPRRFRFPVGKLVVVILTILMWEGARALPRLLQSRASAIAPLFTPQVNHWSGDIARWSSQHGLDPNLLATVMQIESCGHPTVSSSAGAQGLFQVMPFHFTQGEQMLDPETNARRGASFLQQCLSDFAGGDPGLAMACYNGGPSVTRKSFTEWPAETRRYYMWGMGIYTDARANAANSQTLNEWLDAGGSRLCQQAGSALGW
jgi:soluble lytic murein transglycosylase-like protein